MSPTQQDFGHLVDDDKPQRQVATVDDTPRQVKVFNPLDANPADLVLAVERRQANSDALIERLRQILVPGKDFGRIHIANKSVCPEPWRCSPEQNRGHWSPWRLLDPGADKTCGFFGLRPEYPNKHLYVAAAVAGTRIVDVILDAHIVDAYGNVIAEGNGAASVDPGKGMDLNNTMKRAAKRARLDAVNRLPMVSSLFEDVDWIGAVEAATAAGQGNSASDRQKKAGPKFDTGVTLTVMPFGKHKDLPFADMEEQYLEWLVTNMADKPDIKRSAQIELDFRRGTIGDEGPPPNRPQAAPPRGNPPPRNPAGQQQRPKPAQRPVAAEASHARFDDLEDSSFRGLGQTIPDDLYGR